MIQVWHYLVGQRQAIRRDATAASDRASRSGNSAHKFPVRHADRGWPHAHARVLRSKSGPYHLIVALEPVLSRRCSEPAVCCAEEAALILEAEEIGRLSQREIGAG